MDSGAGGVGMRSRGWRSSADMTAVQRLVSRRLEIDWPAVRIHPGDLDWWAVQAWGRGPEQPRLDERVRLWTAAGSGPAGNGLLAFAWFTPPGDLDLVLDRELGTGEDAGEERARAVVDEALAWGETQRDRYAGDPGSPLLAWAAEASMEARLLEAAGRRARSEGRGYVNLTGRLDGPAVDAPAVPPGLVVRPLSDRDVEARVSCSRAAFPRSTMTPDRYRRTFLARLYRPELDLVVLDDTDAVVAFALGWHDPSTQVVELEPVGVDPSRHRSGLGTLVCRSVLAAAATVGATRAVISAEQENPAAVGLYRSLGLAVTSRIRPHVESAEATHPGAVLS